MDEREKKVPDITQEIILVHEPEDKTNLIFAKGLCFSKLFWLFMFGCLFGYVYEFILSFFQFGQFESRAGVVLGPLNPVYGIGFVVVVIALHKIKKFNRMIVVGAIVGGFAEYMLWLGQRLIFDSESWHYVSNIYVKGVPIFNFLFWGGTSFFHAIGWGLMAAFIMKLAYPILDRLIEKIPMKIGKVSTVITVTFMVVNLLLSAGAVIRWNERTYCASDSHICREPNAVDRWFDEVFNDAYMEKIFPNMERGDEKQ